MKDDPICEDRFYALSPRAIRWLKLQRRYEAGRIMGHEARELLLLTEELGIEVTEGERRGWAGLTPYQVEEKKS